MSKGFRSSVYTQVALDVLKKGMFVQKGQCGAGRKALTKLQFQILCLFHGQGSCIKHLHFIHAFIYRSWAQLDRRGAEKGGEGKGWEERGGGRRALYARTMSTQHNPSLACMAALL